jgi:hypothetical protein
MKDLFVFIDGLNLYCNNGNRTKILKKDLKEAKKRGMSDSDIKISAYNILTKNIDIDDYYSQETND